MEKIFFIKFKWGNKGKYWELYRSSDYGYYFLWSTEIAHLNISIIIPSYKTSYEERMKEILYTSTIVLVER